MSALEKQITEIVIPDETRGFFQDKNFRWTKIPEFAVITSINGSGKTQLLDYINNIIDSNPIGRTASDTIIYKDDKIVTKHEKYYHEVYHPPIVKDEKITHGKIEEEKGQFECEYRIRKR